MPFTDRILAAAATLGLIATAAHAEDSTQQFVTALGAAIRYEY